MKITKMERRVFRFFRTSLPNKNLYVIENYFMVKKLIILLIIIKINYFLKCTFKNVRKTENLL